MIHQLESRQTVDATIEEVWEFFSKPGNLNVLTPPNLDFRITGGDTLPIHNGQIISYSIRILPMIRVSWVTEIKHVVPLASFVDEQRAGPYRFWFHRHDFIPADGGVEIVDTVHYSVGFSFLGEIFHRIWIKRQLEYIFHYRNGKMNELFRE